MPAIITWWRRDLAALHPEGDPDAVFAVGADLMRRWGEPHRRYHTSTHLVEMLRAIEELEDVEELSPRDAALARVAAWFHDAVYALDAGSAGGSGEAASGSLAGEALSGLGLPRHDVARVRRLIEDSATHDVAERTGIRAAFHDADLWILAEEPARFDEYCRQVRQEYAHVPDAAYALGRRAVLEPLARREHVYLTGHAREHWEQEARANLARELARLG